jgi:hypothetical protein
MLSLRKQLLILSLAGPVMVTSLNLQKKVKREPLITQLMQRKRPS